MIFNSIQKNILFSTATCVRCGKALGIGDDEVMQTCKECKCIK